jgi:hypothetical protein
MPFINHTTKEINCKIVYYGCGMSGKTTNLQYIYDFTSDDTKGKLVNMSMENERTLFFDFLPLDAGIIGGFKTRLHLYSVPGQSFYEVSNQIILKGVDGIVFVLDSQRERLEANLESYENLKKNLEYQGYEITKIPLVLQFNKRDLSNIATVEELSDLLPIKKVLKEKGLNPPPEIEAIANKGVGVFETLKEITKLVIADLKSGVIAAL